MTAWHKPLKEFLASQRGKNEALSLSGLDGFLAGVLVCPRLIMPSGWLPYVWSEAGDPDQAPVYEDLGQAQAVTTLIMQHYNSITDDLMDRSCHPIIDIDEARDEILWRAWVGGFARAMSLAPESWNPIMLSSDSKAVAALAGLRALIAINEVKCDLPQEEQDRLIATAHTLIGPWVQALNDWRVKQPQARRPSPAPSQPRSAFGKVGRNDPCPCGSGRKYKKCCGGR